MTASWPRGDAATRHIDRARARTPVPQDGVVDSIRFVLSGVASVLYRRMVLKLLTISGCRSDE